MGHVLDTKEALVRRESLATQGKKVVFTNGVFDLLHRGHVELLEKARAQGDALIVGINSDSSTRRLKGPTRPLVPASDRAVVLAALASVDVVVEFEEDTPEEIIKKLIPDVLVKGADYAAGEIVGRNTVEANGGRVVRVPLVEGCSTTKFVEEIARRMQESKQG